MPYWVISADDKGKLIHSGPFTLPQQAQNYSDDNVKSKFNEIIQTRSSSWDRARGEVKFKLSELFKDTRFGTKRIFDVSKLE